jgi:hypothetical protein
MVTYMKSNTGGIKLLDRIVENKERMEKDFKIIVTNTIIIQISRIHMRFAYMNIFYIDHIYPPFF